MSEKIKIKKLIITKFRGLNSFTWKPEAGTNIILGGGDCGKSTILDAIGILFHPGNGFNINESDFWKRNSEDQFSIEAVIAVSEGFEFSSINKIYWPWEWDGNSAILPSDSPDGASDTQCPVFRVIVTGNSEFDVFWEIIQPDGNRDYFPSAIRKRIGLVKLGGETNNDRDLRLVYGSALDRLLSDKNLKSRIGNAVAQIPLTDHLSLDSKASLTQLDDTLNENHLPSGLSIGLTGGEKGVSIGSLVGLLASKEGVNLPLSNWGAGTRRMTSLHIASAKNDEAKIMTIDEIERGLEPYRLRQLLTKIIGSEVQSFVTTHSSVAISSSESAQLWYLDAKGSIGKLEKEKISEQQKRDPETFLSRVSVIVEGETELGFVSSILEKILNGNPLDAGIKVCLGQGDTQLLNLLEALVKSGILFCGFVDNDGGNKDRWGKLKTEMTDHLFQWKNGCIETNILSLLPTEYLVNLFKDADNDWDGYRLRTVADRLNINDKTFESIANAANQQGLLLVDLIIAAATGNSDGTEDNSEKKAWRKHARNWFKKADGSGGRELLHHLIKTDKWKEIEPIVRPFFNSILSCSDKPIIEVIDL